MVLKEVAFIGKTFNSTMRMVTGEAVVLWIILAAITGIITYMLYRRGKIKSSTAILFPILVLFIAFTLTITVFGRVPAAKAKYKLELFWTIKHILAGRKKLIGEVFWNVVLFVPTGFIVSALIPRRAWITLLICAAGSAVIELTQLLMHRGLFEFDDIIYNSAGAVIGLLLFLLLKKIGGRFINGS